MREREPAAGGVVMHGGRVLLVIHRGNGEVRLPKGAVDTDESPAEAARREVTEETGFAALATAADLGEQRLRYHDASGLVQRRVHWYRLSLLSWARRPRSGRDASRFAVRWFGPDEAFETLTFDAERVVLEAALALGP